MHLNLPIITFLVSLICGCILWCLHIFIKGKSIFVDIFALVSSVILFILCLKIYILPVQIDYYLFLDKLAEFVVLFIGFFGAVITLYSVSSIRYYIKDEKDVAKYYAYLILTIGCAVMDICSNHILAIIIFWGITGLLLYLMLNLVSENSAAAKKSLIIIGGSDAFMILGFAILWYLTGEVDISKINVNLTTSLATLSFLCILSASLAKAGAFPLHTWIPEMAEKSPVQATAFFPASIDKLLGIYLLARMCLKLYNLNFTISFLLMLIGAVTILAAVFMAMVQHNYKKLLSYHAVSQVGYMVLGLGSGSPVGIAGGLFHMLNNAIYKSCLFLTCSSVEQKAKTDELDKLGGYAKIMPLVFFSFLVSALSISGVPPFNGFVSKWMVYQGVIEAFIVHRSLLTVIFLISAVFGSALTLASFIKLTHAVFLGQQTKQLTNQPDKQPIHWTQIVSTLALALLCVIFGIFAFQVPIKHFISPSLSPTYSLLPTNFIGIWQPGLATLLIVFGIIVGFLIFAISKIKFRETEVYLLAELKPQESKISGTEFYNDIKELSGFKLIYFLAEKKFFDIYEWCKNIVFGVGSILSFLHTGNLHFYLSWVIIGLAILLLFG